MNDCNSEKLKNYTIDPAQCCKRCLKNFDRHLFEIALPVAPLGLGSRNPALPENIINLFLAECFRIILVVHTVTGS